MLESWIMKKFITFIIVALLYCTPSFSSNSLKGIDKVKILIEELNDNADKCGLSKNQIETSIKYILQNSKIEVVSLTTPATTLYAQITLGSHSGGFCYSSTRIELYDYMRVKGNMVDVVYYGSTTIAAGGVGSTFSKFLLNQLEGEIKKFVVAWSEVNK